MGSTVIRARQNRGQGRLLPPLLVDTPVAIEVELWIENDCFHSQRVKVEEVLTVARYVGVDVTVARHHEKAQGTPIIRIDGRDAWLGFDDIRSHLFSRVADRLKKRDLFGK